MSLARRLSIAVGLALGAVMCVATVSVADLFPAGNYRITTTTADTFVFTSIPPYTQASVFVQDTTTQANPQVGPSSTTRVVQVSLYWSGIDANGNPVAGNGCSDLSTPTDFLVASGGSAASLQTSFKGSEQPCDQFQQVLPPVSVSASWTSSANTGTGRTSSQYSCGGYRTEALGTTANFGANATFSISALAGSFSDNEASLRSSDSNVHSSGTPASNCFQPGGKGAGPGPQAPGRYTFQSNLASFGESQTNQTDPTVNVFVNQFTNTSSPQGGGMPTRTSETDVELFVSGSAGFGFGCFVLRPPATFTFGSTSATLHISLASDAETCPNSFSNFPFLPTDVNVTWTGIGPLATMHSDSQGSCAANFSEQTFFDDTNNNATATATMSYFQGTTFNGDESSLGTSKHSFQIQGATRCPGGQ